MMKQTRSSYTSTSIMDPRLLILLVCCCIGRVEPQTCSRPVGETSSCVCETNSGIVDLTALGNPDGEKEKFKIEFNGHVYLFNPCYGISYRHGDEQSCLEDTTVCQHDSNGNAARSCGSLSSERIYQQGDQLSIEYTGGNGGRLSIVNLICDKSAKNPSFTGVSDDDLTYTFNLRSKCVCPGAACHLSKSNKTAPGDVGIALMFLSVFGIVAYFIIGAVIMKYKFQKTGLEMIPQKAFWFSLPYLIKDGFIFTFSPLIRLVKKDKALPTDI